MSKRIITKELAVKIADKLDAKISKEGAHDIAEIFYKDVLITWFGIRRGSEKDKGHDYIPGQIFLNAFQAKRLGQCPITYAQWVEIAKAKGAINEKSEE